MTKAKKIWIILVTIATFLIGGFYWLTWSGSSKDIEGVAGQFKAKGNWELKADSVTPPRTICLDGACPEVVKKWLMDKPLTKKELMDVLNASGWSGVGLERSNCFDNFMDISNSLSCSANGRVGKYTAQIYIKNIDGIDNKPSLTLFVKE